MTSPDPDTSGTTSVPSQAGPDRSTPDRPARPDGRLTFVQAIDMAPPIVATRHLSAGAYVDEEFSRTACLEIYRQPYRLVAPSYGFDLSTVLTHCLRARGISKTRDLILVASFVIAALTIVGLPAVVAVISILIGLATITGWWRLVRDIVALIRAGMPTGVGNRLLLRGGLLLIGSLVGIPIIVLMGSVFAALGVGLAGAVTGQMSGVIVLALLLIVALCVVVFGASIGAEMRRQSALEKLAPGRLLELPPPDPRLDEIRRQESGNTTVYSGFGRHPFVGSGVNLFAWSSAQRLIRPDGNQVSPATEHEREYAAPPFRSGELSAYVRERLRGLIDATEPELRIPRLVVTDEVFLAGTEVAGLTPNLAAEDVDDIVRNPTAPARHYLAARVISWSGQLVTSVYAHFAVQGQTLYLDISAWALPPCRSAYRMVDDVRSTGSRAYLRRAVHGFLDTPRAALRAPLNLARMALDRLARRSDGGAHSVTRGYDYGARLSLRELGSGPLYGMSMQDHDVTKYARILERRIVAAVGDFLDLHGVDTTEFHNRAMNILNNGIMHTGSGDFHMGSGNAVGPNAKAQGAGRR